MKSLSHKLARRDLKLPFILPVVSFLIAIIAWDAAIAWFNIPPEVIPTSLEVFGALRDGLVNGVLATHSWVTLQEVLYGFVIGAALGFIGGVTISESAILRMALFPHMIAFQFTPKVAIAPLFVIWLGYGIESKVAIAASVTFFPILINTAAGLRAVDGEVLEMMNAFQASRWQIFSRVKIRFALPYMFAGIDVALSFAVIGAIVSEFVGSTAGLGYLILQANYQLDIAKVFAVLVVLAAIGISLNACVRWISGRMLFWHDSER